MMDFIEWNELNFNKTSGKEKLRCPKCDQSRSDKKDRSLLINHNDGYGKCFYCEALTFRESKKDYTQKEYKLPEQTWRNYTDLSEPVVKWFESRKIPQHTLLDLGITEETYYQPSLQKEVTNIVFNYFEKDVLVNKKYRSGGKKFTQTSGAKSIFYNINSCLESEEVYIVEGEMDVLALHSIGVKAVLSVPNGANDNDEYWSNSEPFLSHVTRFIIAVDNDDKGNDLKDKIAQRLGRYRCEFIEWQNKDANGDLIEGCIEESLGSRKRFPVSGTFNVEELKGGILDLYENGLPDTIYPKHHSFGEQKKIFSLMRGQVCTITGIPSHGKSNYSEWHVLNLVKDYDMKASFFSPEHMPMALHQTNFIQKAVGRNFWKDYPGIPRITKDDIDRYTEWANEKIYITAPEGDQAPTWDWLLDTFKEQMYSYGIDIFVVDAFNKLQLPSGNKLDEINRVLTRLTSFAQANNVIVLLVAHPTKMQKTEDGLYSMPSLYDVSGSADFRNQTHSGYCIYRYFENEEHDGYTTFTNLKTKFSFQGEIGAKIDYEYHVPTGRYYERGQQPTDYDLTQEKEYGQISRDMVEDLYEFDDDCPF